MRSRPNVTLTASSAADHLVRRADVRRRFQAPRSPAAESASPAGPAHDGGSREVACVGEPAQHHEVTVLHPARGDRVVQGDRDGRSEEVAVLVEGVRMPLGGQLQRLGPVAQEGAVRLIGDEEVDVRGRDPEPSAQIRDHLRDQTVAACQNLGDAGVGEPDPRLGLPPVPSTCDRRRAPRSCRRRDRRCAGSPRRGPGRRPMSSPIPLRSRRPGSRPARADVPRTG